MDKVVERVENVTTTVTCEGVVVEANENGFDNKVSDVVNAVSEWAKDNPKVATAITGVAVIATSIVSYQLVKKILS